MQNINLNLQNIDDFVLNLLSGKNIINGLYENHINSISHRDQAKQFFFKFQYPQYGTTIINAIDFIDSISEMEKMNIQILLQKEDKNIQDIIHILIYLKPNIQKLYEAEEKAKLINKNGRTTYFTFNNPQANYFNLDHNYKIYNGTQLIDMSEKSEKIKFVNFI